LNPKDALRGQQLFKMVGQ